MNKRSLVIAAVVLAVIAGAGGIYASNMGFKLNYTLDFTGTANGTNTIALPFNRQTGIDTASQLKADIGATCVDVQRFDNTNNSIQVFAGGRDPDFNLVAGEGNRVRVNADTNYIVVGSHDPSLAVSLDFTGTANGTNTYGYPYHSTAATASALKAEIGAAVVDVQRFDNTNNSLQVFAGGRDPDFNLVPGESYRIRVNADVNHTPSHY